MSFGERVLNYHFSWTGVLIYQNLLNKGIPSVLEVKS
jgi:hypothetical protein